MLLKDEIVIVMDNINAAVGFDNALPGHMMKGL